MRSPVTLVVIALMGGLAPASVLSAQQLLWATGEQTPKLSKC